MAVNKKPFYICYIILEETGKPKKNLYLAVGLIGVFIAAAIALLAALKIR